MRNLKKHKYWCAVGTVKQKAFNTDGTFYWVDVDGVPVGECHIVVDEVLLCRQSRERLLSEQQAKKKKTVEGRIKGIPMCKKCEKKFKEREDLPWAVWVENVEAS